MSNNPYCNRGWYCNAYSNMTGLGHGANWAVGGQNYGSNDRTFWETANPYHAVPPPYGRPENSYSGSRYASGGMSDRAAEFYPGRRSHYR